MFVLTGRSIPLFEYLSIQVRISCTALLCERHTWLEPGRYSSKIEEAGAFQVDYQHKTSCCLQFTVTVFKK